jgi:guanylate kinase
LSRSGFLVVITAPSGSGKTTIYRHLLKNYKDFKYSVSFTTRRKRKDEVEGADYFYISRKVFEKMIEGGDFIEWAIVHGELYGTEKRQIVDCLKRKKICILSIDVQGAIRVMQEYPDAVTIFIEPPSIEELERRLRRRGTESEEEMQIRLMNAQNELEYKNHFKYIVVNDIVEKALKEVENIIAREKELRR